MRSAYIVHVCNRQVMDKERPTNGRCRMSNGCITDKTIIYRKRMQETKRSLNDQNAPDQTGTWHMSI